MRYEKNYLSNNGRISTSAGSAVANSTARYTPFGDWRTEPTATLTDRGYTGHLHNNLGSGSDDLGLIYMNARYYLPNTNRMISPDTIVPNPANPQQFNRYSYALNNPVRFTDPSGHNCYDPGTGGVTPGNCNGGTSLLPSNPYIIDSSDYDAVILVGVSSINTEPTASGSGTKKGFYQ